MQATRPRSRPGALLAMLVVALLAALTLGACGGSSSTAAGSSPSEVLAKAARTLDSTSGVHISLSTDNLPDGVQGIKSATGTGTHAPAFDGTITVVLSGQDFDVPVIAVDGKVYAQIPLTPGWQDVDPGDYGAPDPAGLMSPGTGFSSLLTATTGLKAGDSVRGGQDNKEVLTSYTGNVPGTAVQSVIPGASGSFDAAYTVTSGGELRQATLTGTFYPGSDPMTYTIGFDDYGTDKDITAP